MSTETRTIRPYRGLADFETALSQSMLHFGSDVCPADSSIAVSIDAHTFLLRKVVLEWAPEDAFGEFVGALERGADAVGIDRNDLSIRVFAKSSYLKIVDHVYTRKLSELDELEPHADLSDPRPRAFRAPRSGFTVDAYILLDRPLEPNPLRPWRKGTWLARATFGVSTSLGRALYRPVPLTDELRAELRLPAKTVRFVDLDDHDPLEPFADQPTQPILYVDEDLLAELGASHQTATNRAMQYEMALDFVTTILYHVSTRADDLNERSLADLEGTLLGELIRRIAGPSKAEQQALLNLVRSDPHRAVAHAEAAIDMRRAMIDSLKGNDS